MQLKQEMMAKQNLIKAKIASMMSLQTGLVASQPGMGPPGMGPPPPPMFSSGNGVPGMGPPPPPLFSPVKASGAGMGPSPPPLFSWGNPSVSGTNPTLSPSSFSTTKQQKI